MTPIINLHILAEKFTQLSSAAYFDTAFREFAQNTAAATLHVISHENQYDPAVVRAFEAQLWRVLQFISGSRSGDAPHEVQYTLRKALKEWSINDALVSSASLNQLDFFLDPLNLWDFIERTLHLFDASGYNKPLVRIASPEAYKNKPIFCIPLFHELGHYVDFQNQVTDASILAVPPDTAPPGISAANWIELNRNYRCEHFADLFAACYCGEAMSKSLLAIAPTNPNSFTHPSTSSRVSLVEDFLSGRPNKMIDILQAALSARNLPSLMTRYKAPDLHPAYDDVLIYRIKNDAELFGIFLSAWNYLEEQSTARSAPWVIPSLDLPAIERTINDLTEKSIRNYEIKERWSVGAAN